MPPDFTDDVLRSDPGLTQKGQTVLYIRRRPSVAFGCSVRLKYFAGALVAMSLAHSTHAAPSTAFQPQPILSMPTDFVDTPEAEAVALPPQSLSSGPHSFSFQGLNSPLGTLYSRLRDYLASAPSSKQEIEAITAAIEKQEELNHRKFSESLIFSHTRLMDDTRKALSSVDEFLLRNNA